MTLTKFIEKYQHTKVDFDKAFGYQCVDLYRQYLKDVWGIDNTEPVAGAKQLWLNYDNTALQKKYLKQVSKPAIGDAVVFDGKQFGHVAIVVGVFDKAILCFEQDGFAQDKGAYFKLRPLNNVLGYLRNR